MAGLPNLPTDNLYKFATVIGTVLIAIGGILVGQAGHVAYDLESRVARQENKVEIERELRDALRGNQGLLSNTEPESQQEIAPATPGDNTAHGHPSGSVETESPQYKDESADDPLYQLYAAILDDRNELDLIRSKVGQARWQSWMGMVVGLLGVLIMSFGIAAWHRYLQSIQDKRLALLWTRERLQLTKEIRELREKEPVEPGD